MSEERTFNLLRLVTVQGDTIDIMIPDDLIDEILEEFNAVRGKSDWWYVGNYMDVRAEYKGNCLGDINMNQIIGSA